MHVEYDSEADALYITLEDGEYARGEDIDEDRRVDYGQNGEVIGVEFLNVSLGVLLDARIPHAGEIAEALRRLGHIRILAA